MKLGLPGIWLRMTYEQFPSAFHLVPVLHAGRPPVWISGLSPQPSELCAGEEDWGSRGVNHAGLVHAVGFPRWPLGAQPPALFHDGIHRWPLGAPPPASG